MELVLRMCVVLLKIMELLCVRVSLLTVSAAAVDVMHACTARSGIRLHSLEPEHGFES